ncbi:MAG TPA: ABC transporter permease [Candidatus Ruania gallistercoris]|uniref:ABC transporter permease n=1 Tax=Candidatus Ruania gallistercoris TaxID=2838746 RepID=A0A9D2J617_9MICO|nr:ABC transporter permease [Candidatus Ruania gallistercoris]
MLRMIGRRIGVVLLVVWGTATLVFVLIRLAPGDPAVLLVGPSGTAEDLENARETLALDQPLYMQYLHFLRNLLVLDFGYSRRLGADAMSLVLQRMPATIELAVVAIAIGTVLGFPLGIWAGRRPGSLIDRFVKASSLTLQALPGFWLAVMLMLIFARQLNWLPSSGRGGIEHLILPAATLAILFIGTIARLSQSGLAGILDEPFMETARAKGLREKHVVRYHGIRNMMIPVVTVVGLQVGGLLGGAVVTETVFAWPGLGLLLMDGITNRDYAVVQAATVFIALIVAVSNMVVDLLYAVLDPRIRRGESGVRA